MDTGQCSTPQDTGLFVFWRKRKNKPMRMKEFFCMEARLLHNSEGIAGLFAPHSVAQKESQEQKKIPEREKAVRRASAPQNCWNTPLLPLIAATACRSRVASYVHSRWGFTPAAFLIDNDFWGCSIGTPMKPHTNSIAINSIIAGITGGDLACVQIN